MTTLADAADASAVAAAIQQAEQLMLPAIKTWTLEEAAKKATAVVAKIDVSALPFLAMLSLVKWEEIKEQLRPSNQQPYAIRIQTVCRLIDAPHNSSPQCIQTHVCIDVLTASEQDIERTALELVFHHMRHEIAELIKVDGVRKLNPHDANSKYGAIINKYEHIFHAIR
jgi:hypothetical protein